jgi:hypothetical protein
MSAIATQQQSTQSSGSGSPYIIDPAVLEKHTELVELIKTAESMDDKERQYWFDLLPVMNEDQIQNLNNILSTEKKKLADIDKKYDKKMEKVTQKYLTKWKGSKHAEHRKKLSQQEDSHREEAHSEAENLLEGLE